MDDLLALTERVQGTHFWFRGFRRFVTPALADAARGRTDLRILDCGCGSGHNVPLLQRFGAVYGFDLTSGGLALARLRGRPIVRADAVHVPFASGTFDLVTSFDMLQSVPGDAEAVREMARVTRSGGVVLFTAAALEQLRGAHSEAWREVQRYTRTSARALVEQAGLRVERVSYLFGTLAPLIFMRRIVQRTGLPSGTTEAKTDLAVPVAPVNAMLSAMVMAEAALAPRVAIPFGSSVLVVARKP
jgi:SAM-dependent methyltransferase